MKRSFTILLLMLILLSCWSARASLEYNTFFHDDANAGRFQRIAKVGEYIYWLHAPDDGFGWLETPMNLYRMKPGQGEVELLLASGEDPFLIGGVVCIGEKLLLSVMDEDYESWHPAIINPDGSGYQRLPGNIGSVVMYANTIMNSVDGAIYEISAHTLQPTKIYSYPAAIAADNPILVQREGMNLYFVTDSFDWYCLDLQFMKLEKICRIRGDGFVREYKLYISDYDNGGTYRYNVLDGSRQRISDQTHMFLQGSGEFVLARLQDPAGLGSAQGGRIFDLTWLGNELNSALIGTCTPYTDFLLDGRLYSRDPQANRVDFCTEPVAQLIAQ